MSADIYNFTFYAGVSMWLGNDGREDDGRGPIIVSSLGPSVILVNYNYNNN